VGTPLRAVPFSSSALPDTILLSKKPIPREERLIVPLDVPNNVEALRLVDDLGDSVRFYKLGLEILMGGEYFQLVDTLVDMNKQVMVDLKFFDIPETVKSAVRQLRKHRVKFATVHGNEEMLRAAASEKNGLKILAVTVLTSLDKRDLKDLGFEVDVQDLVLSRARRALRVGCDGVISSGQESVALRSELGEQFLIVMPGIRPVDNSDDQKRTVDVEQAFQNGADYIVVGRPIRNPTGHKTPREAAEDIQRRIAKLFD
jgi:orotidine-5'-phosphate decarboxylase